MVDNWFHFTPVFAMAVIVILNQVLNGRRARRRSFKDASRLSVALAVDLEALLECYSYNLRLIARGATVLISARSLGQIYRSNAPRLAGVLDERILAPVVAAYAHGDRVDASLVACTKPQSHHTLRFHVDDPYVQDLRAQYRRGCELAEAAISAIALSWPLPEDRDREPERVVTDESVPALTAGHGP